MRRPVTVSQSVPTGRAGSPILALLIGAAAFAVLAFLSLTFAREAGRVASIWPANGAILALVLLRPRGERWWLIGGGLIGNVAADVLMGDTGAVALGLALANAVEIGLAAVLLTWQGRTVDLGRIRDLFRFGVIASLVPVLSSLIAAATLAIWSHEPLVTNVGRWFVADALGLLMITPPLLLAASPRTWRESRAPIGRRLLLGAVLAATLAGVFLQTRFPLLFMVPPVLILIAFRCGIGSAAIALLISAAASLAAVVAGTGPLALVDGGLDPRAMVQQLFLAVLVFTTLPVASVLTDRARTRREGEARLATLSLAETVAGVGSWRLDLGETPRVTWSEQVYRIHGVEPGTFDPAYDDAVDFYHSDDRQTVRDWVAAAIATGQAEPLVLRLIRRDGEERRVRTQCVVQMDEMGRAQSLSGIFQDVTEVERHHAEVAAREQRFRALAEHTSDIIATFDRDGIFRYLSPAVTTVLGWKPEDLVGRTTWSIIHPDDHATLRSAYRAYLGGGPGGTAPHIRYRAQSKDGAWVWVEAHPTGIWDTTGAVIEIQDTVRDITAAKALEDALTQAKEAAEAAVEAKSEFLANMSHELRTPLTSVIGYSGLLKARDGLGETERLFADRIAASSQALLAVINDILDYSKLEAGGIALEDVPLSPRALAEVAAGVLEPQALGKGLALSVEVDAAIPQRIMGDEGRLKQVLLNFLSNAVKFTREGSVRLVMSRRDDRLRVEVIDTGIGLTPEQASRLFQRFSQADTSTTRQYGGTGLGLAISRKLIEAMDGAVGVTSEPDQGSTFWLTIPLRPAMEAELDETADNADIVPNLKILLADDVEANRELMRALVRDWPVSLITVADGKEAVETVRGGDIDLVLMDIQMPGMDGLTATRAIRALNEPVATTPIIGLTADALPEQMAVCRAAGMDGHAAKPIVLVSLVSEINRVMEARKREDAA